MMDRIRFDSSILACFNTSFDIRNSLIFSSFLSNIKLTVKNIIEEMVKGKIAKCKKLILMIHKSVGSCKDRYGYALVQGLIAASRVKNRL